MKQIKGSIDPSKLAIDDTPYTAARRGTQSKYEPLFQALKPGQRLKCPRGTANRLSAQYKKWLATKGNKDAKVRARDCCDDGFGGVWLLAEQEAPKTVWRHLKKAA